MAVALAIVAVFATRTVLAQMNIPLYWMVRLSMVLAPAMLVGALVGTIATVRGSRFSGDMAMALIIGCSLFQLGNAPRAIPEPAEAASLYQAGRKFGDACVGRYEFPPDNVFRTGAEVKIWREGERMFLQATGRRVLQGVHEIFPESETNFFLPVNGAELTIVKNDKGEVMPV